MVSKIIKKTTPTKSTTHRRKRTTPTTTTTHSSTKVISTLNDAVFTCRRRLVKLFTKLARINGSPVKKSSPYRHRFKKLPKTDAETLRTLTPVETLFRKPLVFGLLPPLSQPKITIVLDLDETLVHSKPDPPPEKYDFTVRPIIDGQVITFYVAKRPGVDELLEFLGKRKDVFEVVMFSAGLRAYASLVVDKLDEGRIVMHRLYKDSCREVEGRYVKDLMELGRDLKRVVIVDDNPCSYFLQPENGIPVRPFVDDGEDRELWRLMELMDGLVGGFEDLRDAVKLFSVVSN